MSVVFRRIRGRIIPIEKKDVNTKEPIKKRDVVGALALTGGAALSGASGLYAAKNITKANFAYGKAANLRGASKLVSTKGSKYLDLIRQSAAHKIAGKGYTKKAFVALAVGSTVGGLLASYGANKLVNGRIKNEEKAFAVGTTLASVASGVGLAIFGRKVKLGSLVNAAKHLNKKKPVGELFKLYSKEGMKKTANTVGKYANATYKGVKPKPATVYNASQLDMFAKKKINLGKWLKGDF